MLQPGMQIAAYYATDSYFLYRQTRAAVRETLTLPSAVIEEYAAHSSTVIYLTVLKASHKDFLIDHLLKALMPTTEEVLNGAALPDVFVKYSPDAIFDWKVGPCVAS